MTPSWYDEIRFHAQLRPHATAVVRGVQAVTYSEFAQDIDRVTRILAREKLAAGSLAVVTLRSYYAHWLAVLALNRLGVASVSIVDVTQLDLVDAQAWIGDPEAPAAPAGVKSIVARPEWLKTPLDELPPFEDRMHPDEAMERIVMSSGTTGAPKRVQFLHGNFRTRVLLAIPTYTYHTTARVLSLVPIQSVAGWALPIAAWAAGSAVLLPAGRGNQNIAETVIAQKPTSLFVSPAQLTELLVLWPKGQWADAGMTIYVGGAALPATVNRETRARISPSLYIIYGSTEASTITVTHAAGAEGRPGFVGHRVPYAQVEAVDEEGNVVPAGETGILRTKGEGMCLLYVNDPETTAECYRDGWFYPGDTGSIDAEGNLTVQGRVSELMNLGGVKVAPDPIDEVMSAAPNVKEAASFALPTGAGDVLWLAVVGENVDKDGLLARFKQSFPIYPQPKFAFIGRIPRNDMGKVKRVELREQVQRAVERKKQAPPKP